MFLILLQYKQHHSVLNKSIKQMIQAEHSMTELVNDNRILNDKLNDRILKYKTRKMSKMKIKIYPDLFFIKNTKVIFQNKQFFWKASLLGVNKILFCISCRSVAT